MRWYTSITYGGCEHQIINASCSFIGSGHNVFVFSSFSNAVGGNFSHILAGGEGNFIGSGLNNTIDTNVIRSSIVGGQIQCLCTGINHSFIGGGFTNTIDADCAAILGGANNTVSGAYSSILGGRNNNIPVAFTDAAVFGNGVTAVSSNTLHVECLNAVNTPNGIGTLPPGSFYYLPVTTPPPVTACVLYIA